MHHFKVQTHTVHLELRVCIAVCSLKHLFTSTPPVNNDIRLKEMQLDTLSLQKDPPQDYSLVDIILMHIMGCIEHFSKTIHWHSTNHAAAVLYTKCVFIFYIKAVCYETILSQYFIIFHRFEGMR